MGAYAGSWLQMSQISMFMAQSGPMSMSLVALSTMEFTIFETLEKSPSEINQTLLSPPNCSGEITAEITKSSNQ